MIEADVVVHSRVTHRLRLAPLTADAIKPFGAIITSPAAAGERTLYTEWLGSTRATMTPRLHVNHIAISALPIVVDTLECHPFSAQVFLPIDVSRFVVVVAPANSSGRPDLALAEAFVAQGNIGIVYAAGVWHARATVLDRDGSFAVFMWRNDSADDEQFLQLDACLQLEDCDR